MFPEILDNLKKTMEETSGKEAPLKKAVALADANYSFEKNLQAAEEREIEVLTPDTQFRARDERFDGRRPPRKERKLTLEDFKYDKKDGAYICPNGKKLLCRGLAGLRRGQKARRWSAAEGACAGRPNIGQCISSRQRKEKRGGEEAARDIIFNNQREREFNGEDAAKDG